MFCICNQSGLSDIELYNKAKEAYYNGVPIMEDFEFDELEKRIGLENKSYIGSKKNPSYTIEHPYIMGSLSKVQIKAGDNGDIAWDEFFNDVLKYIKYNGAKRYVGTPKYDGCSFECCVNNKEINTISSRGDGRYGKDLKQHLSNHLKVDVDALNEQTEGDYVIRGEVLIDRFVFEEKYSDFVNPRSFVSGVLNRDYCNDPDFLDMLNDLSIVIYEIKVKDTAGNYVDKDWFKYNYPDSPTYRIMLKSDTFDCEMFESVYKRFADYRSSDSLFALDGFVLKPTEEYRMNNTEDNRPKDCIAVKFIPMLQETEIVDIKWQLSNKTDEYTPVIIVNPVIMDGKQITKASAHNYGYVMENKVGVGSKVILSLAGDIIPFIYKVTDVSNFNPERIGNIDIEKCVINGVHLYKKFNAEERTKSKFLASAQSLGIPSIGPSAAEKIFDYIKSNREEPVTNILFVSPSEIKNALGGKIGITASNAFSEYLSKVRLKDIIVSCAFPMCGEKSAEQIVKYLAEPGSEDWTSLPSVSYRWAFDNSSYEYNKVLKIMSYIGKTIDDEKRIIEAENATHGEKIPVILTGEPNNYTSKADFLSKHPEYVVTGSWKEVKIVFTNSLDSNSGKMKKAREKGVEIMIY